MAKIKINNFQEYLDQHPKWVSIFQIIKKVIIDTELEETIKWGAPCYTINNKNVISVVAFKNHCAIWFHKGALLKDHHQILINAQPGKTQMLRQLRFNESDEINILQIRSYINEAIQIEKK